MPDQPPRESHLEIGGGGGKWRCSSNAGRVIRRRDQHHHQPRPRIMQRPNHPHPHPPSFAQKRPWKFPDPFSDPTLESCPPKNNNSFLSLLPPPPPRTSSKILPPSFPNASLAPAVKVTGNSSHVAVKESPPPPPSEEQLQRDDQDNEWIKKISDAIKKEPTIISPSPSSKEAIYRATSVDLAKAAQMAGTRIPTACHKQMGSAMPRFSGAQRFAPAVQIRSVIPVCAAPPPVRPKDAAAASDLASSVRPKDAAASELASSLGKLKL